VLQCRIKRLQFWRSRNSAEPITPDNGRLINQSEGTKVRMVARNGHRLTLVKTQNFAVHRKLRLTSQICIQYAATLIPWSEYSALQLFCWYCSALDTWMQTSRELATSTYSLKPNKSFWIPTAVSTTAAISSDLRWPKRCTRFGSAMIRITQPTAMAW